jgi:SAM-dependent methyltransferase
VCHEAVIDLYERHAHDYDQDRSRRLQEREWLDKFLAFVDSAEPILDVGCGVGEPIARYLIERGYRVLGVDSSPTMIEICRGRFPGTTWLVGDMRQLRLRHRFAGVVAWDSFFHLHGDDQRGMFKRFAAHTLPGAPLMFTSGTSEGEAIGSYHGAPLYHGSLDAAEYEQLLGANNFSIEDHIVDDPQCGMHTIWLATYTAREGKAPSQSA